MLDDDKFSEIDFSAEQDSIEAEKEAEARQAEEEPEVDLFEPALHEEDGIDVHDDEPAVAEVEEPVVGEPEAPEAVAEVEEVVEAEDSVLATEEAETEEIGRAHV